MEYFEEINHRKKLKKVNPMKRRSTKIEGISEKWNAKGAIFLSNGDMKVGQVYLVLTDRNAEKSLTESTWFIFKCLHLMGFILGKSQC